MWRESYEVEQCRYAVTEPRLRHAVQPAVQLKKLGRGKPVIEAKVFGKKANLAARLHVARGSAQDLGLSAGRKHQAEQHFDGGALAGAVRSEEAEHLTPRHFQGEVSDRYLVAEDLAESAGSDREISRRAHHVRLSITST